MATKQNKRGVDVAPITPVGDPFPIGPGWRDTTFVDAIPPPVEEEKPKSGTIRRVLGDHAVSALRGAIAVPEAVVGLADMATGGAAGKFLENEDGIVGFRPKQARAMLDEAYSPEHRAAQQEFQQADGVLAKTGAAITNPSLITNAVAESLPLMGAGAVVGRGALALAPRMGTLGAAALGEGVTGAGSAAEQIRQETPDGRLTPEQSALAAASGTLTAALGVVGGKVANKLGIGDVDQMLVKGAAETARATEKGALRRMLEGAVSEGLLEELPQSVQEQVLQNRALGKPLDEGVDGAAVMGTLSGMAMGGGANLLAHSPRAPAAPAPAPTPGQQAAAEVRATETVPETGPLSRAANIATEQKAQALERMPVEVAPAPIAEDLQRALLDHANQRAREIDEKANGTKDRTVKDDATGETRTVKGKPAEFLTPDEKAERDFLKEHGGDAQQLLKAYPNVTPAAAPAPAVAPADAGKADAALDRMHRDAERDLQAQREFDPAPDHPMPQAGDVMGANGKPWAARGPASTAARKAGGNFEVVRVQGGFVLRPKEASDAKAQPSTPPVAATASDAPATAPGEKAANPRGNDGVAGAPAVHAESVASPAVAKTPEVDADGWAQFPSEAKSLNIPRADMPQIRAEHRGAMVNFLEARGVTHTTEEVAASTLKPAQREFSPAKVQQAREFTGGDRSILVASDGRILDGHHQWLSKVDGDQPVKVIRLKGPAKRLISLMKKFPSAESSTGQGTPVAPAPAPQPESQAAPAPVVPQTPAATPVADQKPAAVSDKAALPADLAGAKPRYAYGPKQFQVKFASDVDRAAYITAQKTPSPRDADYLAFATKATGMTAAQVRAHGEAVRAALKALAKDAEPGTLEVPEQPRGAPAAAPAPKPTAAPATAAPAPAAEPAAEVPKTKIEDAGEKIGGARKDMWKARGLSVADLEAMSEGEGAELATKANVWKPDYQAMVAEGAEPMAVAMVKMVYDRLAAKPRKDTPAARRAYVQMMQAVRKVYGAVKTEADADAAHKNLLYEELRWAEGRGGDNERAKRNAQGVEDLAAHMREAREVLYSVYKGRSDPFYLYNFDKSKARRMVADGFPAKGDPWKARLVIADAGGPGLTPTGVRLMLAEAARLGTSITEEQARAGVYEVRRKNGRTVAILPTKEDAESAARAFYEAEKSGGKDGKLDPVRPHLDSLAREGLPQRVDRDVTTEDFLKDFGFRGVEFGNWSAQDERQRILNFAYDGLADLADIMGVPHRAMSLNGTLGMAFGARGKGAALAHYEPGKLVINMTKLRGGGSLAHEWAHALDHYFGEQNQTDAYTRRARGVSGWYNERAYNGQDAPKNIRPELASAFDHVMSTLFQKHITKAEHVRALELKLESTRAMAMAEPAGRLKTLYEQGVKTQEDELERVRAEPDDKTFVARERSSYAKDAQALSGKSEKGYWLRPTEMFARAFESWVFDRLMAMGAKSEYLVHGVEADRYATGGYKGNPYPAGVERERVNAAFNQLASEIKTREEDGNVVMFSRRGAAPVKLPDAVIGGSLGSVTSLPEYAAAKAGDIPAAVVVAKAAVTDELVAKVRELIGDEKPVIVPVVANEASGHNRIPAAAAEVLADKLGLTTNEGIVQANKPKRTALSGLDRIFAAPVFDGPVEKGKTYLLLDDTLTQGGTFAALASHIEQNGGRVVGAVALTGKGYSAKIAATPETLQKLRDLHGDLEQQFQAATGYGFDGLTESEARYLAGHRPAHAVRDRIAQEGRRAGASEDPGTAPRLKRSAEQVARDRHLGSIQQTVDAVAERWANAPQIIVARNMQDRAIPERVREIDARQRAQGASGVPYGFFFGGKVYLLSEAIPNEREAIVVMFHEALGHYGLRGVFGESLVPILKQIVATRRALVAQKAEDYGLDMNNERHQIEAAEEVLAEMAQNTPTLGFVRRAIAAIRTWLRKHVPGFQNMALTDDEIIRSFILPARDFVERGRDRRSGTEAQLQPSFSRQDQTETPDTRFSRVDVAKAAREHAIDFFASQKTFNSWWHKTIGTQQHKAQISPEFKKVYDGAQDFIADVSRIANDAADLAPTLLNKMESARDVLRRQPKKVDLAKAGDAVFKGTLEDQKTYTDDELRAQGLTEEQVKLYREFRAATAQSLNTLAESTIRRLAEGANMPFMPEMPHTVMADIAEGWAWEPVKDDYRQGISTLADKLATAYMNNNGEAIRDVKDTIEAAEQSSKEGPVYHMPWPEVDALARRLVLAQQIKNVSERTTKLLDEGYAPLMRFGQYAVSVRGADGALEAFYLFESEAAANRKARELREGGQTAVSQSIMSQKSHELLGGINPESLELFGDILEKSGSMDDGTREVWQTFVREAVSQRSALKRTLKREGYAGFSTDLQRVLAAFLTSNARLASKNLHFGQMLGAVQGITAGDVKDEAVDLIKYVQNPTEEAQALRGLLFLNFIGGSVASAITNMTQPLTMTLPWLAQYGGAARAGATLGAALKQALGKVGPATELGRALERAEKEGIVSPQEIHQLQAEASRNFGSNSYVRKAAFVWGSLFALAEQFNRRVTFIAAYQTATRQKIDNPFEFAERAVAETQGVYNRANRPNWARGAVGGTLFTFKQFSITYLEFLKRLPPKERVLALAILVLAAGADGLPFAEDIADVIDTIAQAMGYNWNTKAQKVRFATSVLGEGAGEFVLRGFSAIPGMPIDVQARMGLGNLIPGTGVAMKSKSDNKDEVLEALGPVGGLLKGALSGQASQIVPVAVRNLAKGIEMWQSGEYRDMKGRRVIDVDGVDALMKGIGFQPSDVAQASRKASIAYQDIGLNRHMESEIATQWAEGLAETDADKVRAARERLAEWNQKNPESMIKITPQQIRRRVQEIRSTRADRLTKSAPKEIRRQVAAAL